MKKYQSIAISMLFFLSVNIHAQNDDEHIFDRGYHLQWSPDGEKIAFADWVDGQAEMWVYSFAEDDVFQVLPGVHGDYYLSWLPNSEDLIFDSYDQNGPPILWSINIFGSIPTPLTSPVSIMPTASPCGNYVAFCNGNDIIKKSLSGGQETNLTYHESFDFHPSWSPDGTKVLFTSERSGNADIWVVSSNGGVAQQITFDAGQDDRASWHPNSSDITFVSNRTGIESIFIVNVNTLTPQLLVENGSFPTWRFDGKKMAFANREGIWIKDMEGVGLQKIEKSKKKITVYPNPGNGTVLLRLEETPNTDILLNLIDMQGNLVFKQILENTGNLYKLELPTLLTGYHLLKIIYNEQTVSTKILLTN